MSDQSAPQITFVWSDKDGWVARCGCGFLTSGCYTFEGAGRQLDVHLAERSPIPSKRFPCPTMLHSVPFEYDPTPLAPGEGRVIPRRGEIRNA